MLSIVKHIELQLANLFPFSEELLAQLAMQRRFSRLAFICNNTSSALQIQDNVIINMKRKTRVVVIACERLLCTMNAKRICGGNERMSHLVDDGPAGLPCGRGVGSSTKSEGRRVSSSSSIDIVREGMGVVSESISISFTVSPGFNGKMTGGVI